MCHTVQGSSILVNPKHSLSVSVPTPEKRSYLHRAVARRLIPLPQSKQCPFQIDVKQILLITGIISETYQGISPFFLLKIVKYNEVLHI